LRPSGDLDHRALVVGEQRPPPAAREAVVPDQRVVAALVAVDVAVRHVAGRIIFRDEGVAVVDEVAGSGRARHLPQAAERIVGELGVVGPRGGGEAVIRSRASNVKPIVSPARFRNEVTLPLAS
jgi:hypothetical protein